MASGEVTVFIASVDKLSGEELESGNLYTNTVLLGTTRQIETSIVPRTDDNGNTRYDVVTIVTELS